MGLVSWIVLGFLAGLVGGMVTGARQARGCLPRIVVGVLGALIGGALARAAGIGTVSGVNLGSIAIAALGAVLLLFVLEAIERR
ncbi:MAG: GlsB/YeaQ/YmgE family stress response membrane protein [Actinobacteria bacterium]|nr:GlsB/YeaQ/YmgE family stress response membrane protein [Actinomycetota bacterium]